MYNCKILLRTRLVEIGNIERWNGAKVVQGASCDVLYNKKKKANEFLC